MTSHISAGVAIEVRRTTQDGYIWIDAVVASVGPDEIVATLPGGKSLTIPRNQGLFRPKQMERHYG